VAAASGQVLTDPADVAVVEARGFRASHAGLACDVAIVGAGPAGLSAASIEEGELRDHHRARATGENVGSSSAVEGE
jgi:hypothetical protein